MRLIDDNELYKIIDREHPLVNRLDIKALVDLTPTAYDIDKVIEELEYEAKKEYEDENTARYSAMCKAIEIVKAGLTKGE